MSNPRDHSTRRLLVVSAAITSLALLLASIALIIWAWGPGTQLPSDSAGVVTLSDAKAGADPLAEAGVPASAPAGEVKPKGGGKRFTLQLGQGFRFRDGVVIARQEEGADIVFKYVPPQVGGMALRYNPVSQQVEQGLEPTLTAPLPLLLTTHINVFEEKPDVSRITTGDMASWQHQATVGTKTRFVLLQNQAGDQYLLTLDELEAAAGKYDDWRIGFAYEKVQLPLGLAGGKISKRLPGSIIFRDWFRTKTILRVDLTTGKEVSVVDGILPSLAGDRLLGYADSSGAYLIRDMAGKTLHTIRFNEQVMGPVLSPDGKCLAATVYRPGPEKKIGTTTFPGVATLSVGLFDLAGRETAAIVGYDDAAWTPDGKLIATGSLTEPGLFEINPASKRIRPIDARIGSPFQPDVSPDGKTVAFVTGDKIWLIERDGKNLRQLYAHGMKQQRPAFSPDGTSIAFVICNRLGVDFTGEVFVIDIKTQEVTALRTNMGLPLVPDPSTRLSWVK